MHGAGAPNFGAGIAGIVLALVWLGMMAGFIGGYIFFLVTIWKMMRAHEAISTTLAVMAERLADRRQT